MYVPICESAERDNKTSKVTFAKLRAMPSKTKRQMDRCQTAESQSGLWSTGDVISDRVGWHEEEPLRFQLLFLTEESVWVRNRYDRGKMTHRILSSLKNRRRTGDNETFPCSSAEAAIRNCRLLEDRLA